MSSEFEECLKKKKLSDFSRGPALAAKELAVAEGDFETAQTSLAQKQFKWATIQAYYAMFRTARALLFAKKYKEKSHTCLIAAIRTLYVEKKTLPLSVVEYFQKAKMLRENADYSNEWSEDGAAIILNAAREFLAKSKKLIVKVK